MESANLIACSRMYNVSPEVQTAWDQLFAYIIKQSGIPLQVIYHTFPSPIEELWALPNMGCVLMCGYPYARAYPQPTLLASPVPSPLHYGGKAVYFTHLLVGEDSQFQSIEDTFGHRICWTIRNSQSGFNALRSFLLAYRSKERPLLYRESIGPIGTFTVGVKGLRDGQIDVVPIDSFSYDLMKRYTPEQVAGTRILATTPAAPFPPLVAGHDIDLKLANAIRNVLLRAHKEAALHQAFETIMVKRFVESTPAYYDTMLVQAEKAEAAGYPMPA